MRITKLLFILMSALGFGQHNPAQFPTFEVPTPEANAFQKNINIPVSHYTGIPSISVPIYNITSGNIAIPVALSYNAQGIRVDEIATRYGLGWNLQTGGAIVRQVNDKVDEFNYLNPQSQNGYFNFDNIVNDQNKLITFHNLYFSNPETTWDLEPDMFSFNCGGISGKFFFNQVTKQPIFQSFEDLKMEVFWTGNLIDGFKITDTQGTSYYFGRNKLNTVTGIEKSEQISSEYYQFHNTDYSPAGLHTGSVSGGDTRIKWDLLEIIDAKGNTVTFTYDFEQLNHKKRLFDGKLSERNITEMREMPIVSMYGRVNGLQRFLRKIEWKNGKVEFVSATSPRLDMGQPSTLSSISPKTIEYIHVYDKQNNLITSHKLNFEYVENNDISNTLSFYHNEPKKRLFLKSVQQTKENQVLNPYEFVYSDILLPNRFSNSVDYWGFYNGKSNGNSYYTGPASNDYSEHNNLAFFNNGGQEVDPVLCQAGLLKQVIYPTKGYSEYTYESNESFTPDFMRRTVNTFSNPSIAKSASFFESNDFKVSPANAPWYSEVYETAPFYIGTRSFAISDKAHTYIYGNNQSGIGLEGTVPFDPSSGNDYQTGLPFNLELYPVSGGGTPVAFNFPTFNLTRNTTRGSYKLKAQRIKEKQGELPEFAMAIHWKEEITPSALKMIVGGNRIKQIVTVDNNGTQMTKRYDYNRFGTSISSGSLYGFPTLYVDLGHMFDNLQVMGMSINEMNQTPTNHAGYSQVTEYIESANEIHKTEYKFTNYVNEGEFFVFPLIPQTDNEWLRGKPLEVRYYKQNSSTNFSLLKETITEYNVPNFVGSGWEDSSYIENLEADNIIILNQQNSPKEYYYSIVKPFKTNATTPDIAFTRNGEIYKFKHYYIGGGIMNVKSVTEKEYLPTGVFETKTEYKYNSPIHNLLKEQSIINFNNEILKSNYFYPQDAEMAEKPHVQDLINQHRIGIPLVTQSFSSTEKVSEVETIYKDWGNGLLAPEIIKTSNGATLEERVKYTIVDPSNGNPLEVQQIGGTPITYIWGYNKTQPIAKIENATYAEVQQYEANLQTLSNGTDEGNLITALNALRTALPNAIITTYTYKPLVGISTVTDPTGNKITYHYDGFNRLEYVTDKNGDVLSDNEYYYKN